MLLIPSNFPGCYGMLDNLCWFILAEVSGSYTFRDCLSPTRTWPTNFYHAVCCMPQPDAHLSPQSLHLITPQLMTASLNIHAAALHQNEPIQQGSTISPLVLNATSPTSTQSKRTAFLRLKPQLGSSLPGNLNKTSIRCFLYFLIILIGGESLKSAS
jgi:hypothetical protein